MQPLVSSSLIRPGSLRRHCLCQAGKKQQQQQPISNKATQGPPDVTNQMEDMEDVIMIDEDEDDEGVLLFDEDEDEYKDEDEGEDGFLDDEDEDEDGEGLYGLGVEDDPGPELLTGNVAWGDKALQLAQAIIERPENSNLSLYLFRVLVPNKTIEVRLDRLDDVYGSPDVDDIERFSRALMQGLEAELGTEVADDIALEVSSPGAERTLIIPQDLDRFKELPMRVEFMSEVGKVNTLILKYLDRDDEGMSSWELADVKANQSQKGRPLSKKQRQQRYSIPVAELQRVRIYVDF